MFLCAFFFQLEKYVLFGLELIIYAYLWFNNIRKAM